MQNSEKFHFVALDNPFPGNYGGVIDILEKIKLLKSNQIPFHLYYFHKPNVKIQEQNFAFARNMSFFNLLDYRPFMIKSRNHLQLLHKISQDNLPIWLEGTHCTFWLPKLRKQFPNRKIFLRFHNIEYLYYKELQNSDNHFFKNIYLFSEQLKLQLWEKKIWKLASAIFGISQEETNFVKSYQSETYWLPAFVSQESSLFPPKEFQSTNKRILFHGNFEITSNQQSVKWILEKMIPLLPNFELAIYGKNSQIFENQNIIILNNQKKLAEQISGNEIIILPIFQKSGVKIKLLDSIKTNLTVFGTKEAFMGSGIDGGDFIFENEKDLAQKVLNFNSNSIRNNALIQQFQTIYDSQKNIEFMLNFILSNS